jgi:predicted MFS family arabinose efflux permease
LDIRAATIASIVNCVAGITGSIYIGKILDKHKNYKRMQIYVAIGVSLTVFLTYISLKFGAPEWVSIVITILGGAPMSSVSVVSYQF